MLETDNKMESIVCRENAFLAQNVIFVSIAFTVLLGTTFPLLAEAIRGTKLSVQAPFFNTVIGPMGYILLLLMGVGTLIPWRNTNFDNLKRNFYLPFIITSFTTLILAYIFKDSVWNIEGYIIFWLSGFILLTIVIEWIKFIRLRFVHRKTLNTSKLLLVIQRNLRRYGGLMIHFGIILIFLGIAGKFFSIEQNITFKIGELKSIGSYDLIYKGVKQFKVKNATHRAAVIDVLDKSGLKIDTLLPAKSFYPTQPQPLTEVAIKRSFWEDLYIIFSSENLDNDETVTLRIFINPLVGIAWMALPIFTLGVGICFLYRPTGFKKEN